MGRKPRTKRGYIRKDTGKVRENLPVLLEKGWSGRKALNYLRKYKRYHIQTQRFYDILREQKAVREKREDLGAIAPEEKIPYQLTVDTELKLSTKYLLFFKIDVFDAQRQVQDTIDYALPLNVLPTTEEAINMVKARIEFSQRAGVQAPTIPYRAQVKQKRWYYNNYRLVHIWKRRTKPIERVKRGQRYAG